VNPIIFKSCSEFFNAEKSGLKPNTVRQVSNNDERFALLSEMQRLKAYGVIQIQKADCPAQSFKRQIQHICFFDGWCIISWKHKGDVQ